MQISPPPPRPWLNTPHTLEHQSMRGGGSAHCRRVNGCGLASHACQRVSAASLTLRYAENSWVRLGGSVGFRADTTQNIDISILAQGRSL